MIGHGIDLVATSRIAQMMERYGDRFLGRCFTEGERAYAHASSKRAAEHLAARFAAKEAVLKALGTGWKTGIAWTDVEVVRQPSGQPLVKLTGGAARVAREMGIADWMISLTHTNGQAMASAIALGRAPSPAGIE